jgi:hypothetical protein
LTKSGTVLLTIDTPHSTHSIWLSVDDAEKLSARIADAAKKVAQKLSPGEPITDADEEDGPTPLDDIPAPRLPGDNPYL